MGYFKAGKVSAHSFVYKTDVEVGDPGWKFHGFQRDPVFKGQSFALVFVLAVPKGHLQLYAFPASRFDPSLSRNLRARSDFQTEINKTPEKFTKNLSKKMKI